jgi:hypothetical protein
MGSPGRVSQQPLGRTALRSFNPLWPGRHVISAAVSAATLWAGRASLHAFFASGGGNLSTRPGAGADVQVSAQAVDTGLPRRVGGGPGGESSLGARRSFPWARDARRRSARHNGARPRSRCRSSSAAGTREAEAGAARTGGAAAGAAAGAPTSAATAAAATPAAAATIAAAGTGTGASPAPGAAPGAAAGGAAGSARHVRLLPHRRAGRSGHTVRAFFRRCTVAARSCCHHDGALTRPVRCPVVSLRGVRCDCAAAPRQRWDPASLQADRLPGGRGEGTGPCARHADAGLGENSRPCGHARVHALPAAPARAR